MTHHILRAEQLSFTYPDGHRAVSDVSFEIRHGESVGIVGPNGAGKSTLVLLLNGCLPAESGSVILGDRKLDRQSRDDFRRRIGLVFQNPDDQLFMPTVLDDVAFGPLNQGLDPTAVKQRCVDALAQMGVDHLAERPTHQLSQGEKKAVAVAGILAMDPDLLILDEPSAELDPAGRRAVINFLHGYVHTRLVVSHDLDLVLETCDRCLVMDEGRLIRDGDAMDILADRSFLEAHRLELPRSLQPVVPRRKRSADSS